MTQQDIRTREQVLLDVLKLRENELAKDLDWYVNHYQKVNRGAILADISCLHERRALKAYFIDHNPEIFRQQFYMASVLMKAAYEAGFGSAGFASELIPFEFFLTALLSDSPEYIDYIACAELAHKNNPKDYHFYAHLWQLLLLDEHAVLKEKIALGAKKGNKRFREAFATETDFFSLFLKRDKAALEAHIPTLINPRSELSNREFFNHWAVICTKLCWLKGIEVEIDHPLVPMALMPVRPLPHYEIEYDFLCPGWVPPKDDFLNKIKSWLK